MTVGPEQATPTPAKMPVTAAQVREKMVSDEGVHELLEDGLFQDARPLMSPEVLQSFDHAVAKNGIEATQIVLDKSKGKDMFGGNQPGQASAFRTDENVPYVSVNSGFLALPADEQKVLLNHELSHVAHDTTAEALANLHNQPDKAATEQRLESEADRFAVCNSENPEQAAHTLAGHFSKAREEKAATLMADNSRLSHEEALGAANNDPHHPDRDARIHDILAYPQQCEKPPVAEPLQTNEAVKEALRGVDCSWAKNGANSQQCSAADTGKMSPPSAPNHQQDGTAVGR